MSSDSLPQPSPDAPIGFADNWAYLKTELNWLDRVLMLSVARHRQDRRTVDRIAQNRADRVSSHWWKGVVTLEGTPAYDEHRKVSPPSSGSTPQGGYQQQLETRIRHSQHQGVVLALPRLRDRLQLSLFEKNMLLIGLAPEVNRRFAKMYRYLQGLADDDLSDLPTVELMLRLLCRNDNEWRQARYQITHDSFLIQSGLVLLIQQPYDTLLTTSIKLSEPLLSFLLAEQPSLAALDMLLDNNSSPPWSSGSEHDDFDERSPAPTQPDIQSDTQSEVVLPPSSFGTEVISSDATPQALTEEASPESKSAFDPTQPHALTKASLPSPSLLSPSLLTHCEQRPQLSWPELIVPEAIAQDLKHWANRVQLLQREAERYGTLPGTIALLTGHRGIGKTTAARAIAHHLDTDLHWIDVDCLSLHPMEQIFRHVESLHPLVLLIKGAGQWLSRSVSKPDAAHLRQWLSHRRQSSGITLWSEIEIERIATDWLQEIDFVLTLPLPQKSDRQRLWERAIAALPETVQSKRGLNTTILSALELTGGDIERVTIDGAIAAAARRGKLNLDDIQNALNRGRYYRALRQLAQARSKK
ncbi:MAG: AAA family ATPase [Elainellaceae cyanobacterium]